jgi:hypothetical protein
MHLKISIYKETENITAYSQHFTKAEGTLLCSQEPSNGPYPVESSPHIPSYFFKIHFNIMRLSMPRSSTWSLSFNFPTENLYIFLIFTKHAACPSYLILPGHNSTFGLTYSNLQETMAKDVYIKPTTTYMIMNKMQQLTVGYIK